jgi:hypothetical protein
MALKYCDIILSNEAVTSIPILSNQVKVRAIYYLSNIRAPMTTHFGSLYLNLLHISNLVLCFFLSVWGPFFTGVRF